MFVYSKRGSSTVSVSSLQTVPFLTCRAVKPQVEEGVTRERVRGKENWTYFRHRKVSLSCILKHKVGLLSAGSIGTFSDLSYFTVGISGTLGISIRFAAFSSSSVLDDVLTEEFCICRLLQQQKKRRRRKD